MIDIHTHILPGVDDGSSSMTESLNLVRQGMKEGIRGAVCTSHVLDRLDSETEARLNERFLELKQAVRDKGWDFSLWLGAELHVQTLFDIRSPLATINGQGRYCLLELPLGTMPARLGDLLFQLSLTGVVPILAHPERNRVVWSNPGILGELVARGVLIQINSGSLTGTFGRKTRRLARSLVSQRMVHFVASDCHDVRSRPMHLWRAYHWVIRRVGRVEAERLFKENPLRVVQGEPIPEGSPMFSKKAARNRRF
ncbi:MAG TPA: hypothetical protein ENN03_07665 [bacterium]|nr:hypothetical protein [bacterium]